MTAECRISKIRILDTKNSLPVTFQIVVLIHLVHSNTHLIFKSSTFETLKLIAKIIVFRLFFKRLPIFSIFGIIVSISIFKMIAISISINRPTSTVSSKPSRLLPDFFSFLMTVFMPKFGQIVK
jgi:hypothetical protein